MSNFIQRDQRRRSLFAKFEKKRMRLKSLRNNQKIPIKAKWHLLQHLASTNRNSCLTRVRNRCVISGRGRGVYQFARLSRIKFRELACQGLFPGITSSSW